MMSDETVQRFGRVVIDDRGISQRPFLLFFGESFSRPWSEITAWAATDRLILDVKTGEERVDSRVLELRCGDKIHFITRSGQDPAFQSIVKALRRWVADKETQSLLAQVMAKHR